ncbi:hypothetical protein OUZ56_008454 [Daphnia magna]|uniref:Uncharacterized protein n=1 Tax=Daphnia magna TaxID=35525 RepID=A0ABR0AD12_9CRUS|nr:hypothetical protein OUZ56_008454 [Daphnia magna]
MSPATGDFGLLCRPAPLSIAARDHGSFTDNANASIILGRSVRCSTMYLFRVWQMAPDSIGIIWDNLATV